MLEKPARKICKITLAEAQNLEFYFLQAPSAESIFCVPFYTGPQSYLVTPSSPFHDITCCVRAALLVVVVEVASGTRAKR